jgi:protein SCO1
MHTTSMRRRKILQSMISLAVPLSAMGTALPSQAAGTMDHQHHHHHAGMAANEPVRSVMRYQVPDVVLTDADGKKQSLREVLADKNPVMLNFIFTSCTAICPAMSGVFSQVQQRLDSLDKKARLVSISIDPEYDTPVRLKEYAKNFSAGPQWLLLTGRRDDSIAIQRAFDAYRGDKMNHLPTTFLRGNPDQPWVRLDGLASADQLVVEYLHLSSGKIASIPATESASKR